MACRPLFVASCSPGPAARQPEWRSSLELADYVAHQELNLSTDLTSPPEGVGLDSIQQLEALGYLS